MGETKAAIGAFKEILNDLRDSLKEQNHLNVYSKTRELLKGITRKYGTCSYDFVSSTTSLVKEFGETLIPFMWNILDHCAIEKSNKNEINYAFAAFYELSVYFARQFKARELRDLITNRTYFDLFFESFPLYYELSARYLGMTGKYCRQLRTAMQAEEKISENLAVNISYVDAVCNCAEAKYLGLFNANAYISVQNAPTHYEGFVEYLDNDAENDGAILDHQAWEKAEQTTEKACKDHPQYAKYHFLAARVLFYKELFQSAVPSKAKLSDDTFYSIKNSLEKAIALEYASTQNTHNKTDGDLRTGQYQAFLQLVRAHRDSKFTNKEIERNKRKLLNYNSNRDVKECPPVVETNFGYAFISYSSSDFKFVYTDLFEMASRGIHYWYDKDLLSGKTWYDTVFPKIKHASCVICYLSDDYMMSDAVRKELEKAVEFKKHIICISLTSSPQISESIKSAVSNDTAEHMDSFKMRALLNAFDDDIITIIRSKEYLNTSHINRLFDTLRYSHPNILFKNSCVSSISEDNNIYLPLPNKKRPYEDAFFYNEAHQIYAIADGISRMGNDSLEYIDAQNGIQDYSISQIIARTFTETMVSGLCQEMEDCISLSSAKDRLKNQFERTNDDIAKIVKEHGRRYPDQRETPGCVGLVGMIFQNKLIYGAAGDCMGLLVRDNQTIIFSQKQTSFAFEKLKIEADRHLLQEKFINKNELGYGVINGDKKANDLFKISYIDLQPGDVIYLATDGISDFIQYSNGKLLGDLPLTVILERSKEFERYIQNYPNESEKGSYDDKTLIRIVIDPSEKQIEMAEADMRAQEEKIKKHSLTKSNTADGELLLV